MQIWTCAVAFAGAILCVTSVSKADEPITILVGSSPGGGYDTYARTIARYLPKHLAGAPTVLVRNQPGAGSGAAAAAIYTTAPKDGTWIGAIFPGIIMQPILNEKSPLQFEPKNFQYLASADNSTRICFTRQASQTKTMADAQRRKTVLGASAAGGSSRDYAYMLNKIAGTKFDVVSGYEGSAQMFLALEKGEVEGMCGIDLASLRAQRPGWVEHGQVNILVETALQPSKELQPLHVPIMWDYVHDDKDKRAAKLIVSQQVFGRPYVAPPETPAATVSALREGFAETLKDPDFLRDAKKEGLHIDPVSGQEVQNLVKDLYTASPETMADARAMIAGPK